MLRDLVCLLYSRRKSMYTYFWCEIYCFWSDTAFPLHMYTTSATARLWIAACKPQICQIFKQPSTHKNNLQCHARDPDLSRKGSITSGTSFLASRLGLSIVAGLYVPRFQSFLNALLQMFVFNKGTDNLGSAVPLTLPPNFLSMRTLSCQSRRI